jgi:hypothetical protein
MKAHSIGLVVVAVLASTHAVLAQQQCEPQEPASRNGPGVRVGSDCRREEGTFVDGRLWGQGKVVDASGVVYQGQFVEGYLFGPGKVTYPAPDERWYSGFFQGGELYGPGRYRDAHGIVSNGIFLRGRMYGPGVLTFPNGGKVMVEFRNSMEIGAAYAIFPNGHEEAGSFSNLRTRMMWYERDGVGAAPGAAAGGEGPSTAPQTKKKKKKDAAESALDALRDILRK